MAVAAGEVAPDDLSHPGLKKMLSGLYDLRIRGETPEIDALRATLNHPALAAKALDLQRVGRESADRGKWLRRVLDSFKTRRVQAGTRQLKDQLNAAADDAAVIDLLRRLQTQSTGVAP